MDNDIVADTEPSRELDSYENMDGARKQDDSIEVDAVPFIERTDSRPSQNMNRAPEPSSDIATTVQPIEVSGNQTEAPVFPSATSETSGVTLDEVQRYKIYLPYKFKIDSIHILIICAEGDRAKAKKFKADLKQHVKPPWQAEKVKSELKQRGKLPFLDRETLKVKLLDDIMLDYSEQLDFAFEHSVCIFLFSTESFVKDKWPVLHGLACLTEDVYAGKEYRRVIPVHTAPKYSRNYKLPMILDYEGKEDFKYWEGTETDTYEHVEKYMKQHMNHIIKKERIVHEKRAEYITENRTELDKNVKFLHQSYSTPALRGDSQDHAQIETTHVNSSSPMVPQRVVTCPEDLSHLAQTGSSTSQAGIENRGEENDELKEKVVELKQIVKSNSTDCTDRMTNCLKVVVEAQRDCSRNKKELGDFLSGLEFPATCMDMLKKWLTQTAIEDEKIWGLLFDVYNACLTFSFASPKFAKELAEADGVNFLVNILRQEWYLGSNFRQRKTVVVKTSIAVLYAIFINNGTPYFKNHNIVEVLMSLTKSKNEVIEVYAMILLTYMVEDKEIDKLTDTSGHIITAIIEWICKALRNKDRRYECYTAATLTEVLFTLATVDGNKAMIVQQEALEKAFLPMLKHGEADEQGLSAACLNELASNESIRRKIQDFRELVKVLESLRDRQDADKDVKTIVNLALAKIQHEICVAA